MNAPLRRVGVVVLVLFALLFANLNWVQAYKADDYRTSQYNGRVQLDAYQHQRGSILDAKGNVIATSVPTKDTLKYRRTYPLGAEFEPIAGYRPVNLGATGIEKAEDAYLSGSANDRLQDIFFNSTTAGGNVTLTLQKSVQQVAYNDLTNNGSGASVGAAVALDPNTGAILAMASTPSFTPDKLASHTNGTALSEYNVLNKQTPNPLLNRAISETYPPGSTFKVIMSAAALSTGQYTPQSVIPAGPSYSPVPGSGNPIRNDAASVCPAATITLIQALTISCNTAYAQLGVSLGPDAIKREAQAFGFGDNSLSLAGSGDSAIKVAASQTGDMTDSDGKADPNFVAQSSIGQYDVRMTPMEGALIAATVANNGVQKQPYLVSKIQDSDLKTVYAADPEHSDSRTPITPAVSAQLQTMMQSVVANGTGRGAQISGYIVSGKTGTAQNTTGAENHRWFIGFASKDGKPIAAVAVLLVNAGNLGRKGAPTIGGDILRAAIAAEGK
jgi:penicillin-binding protein A